MAKQDNILDGYSLSEKMRRARRRFPLGPTEQALYTELVAICNEADWDEVFPCSNDELCRALRISENTLTVARNMLIQASLVYYKSGKSKRQFGQYSFSKKFPTTSKNETVGKTTTSEFEVNPGVNPATNPGVNPATNAADYIRGKTETETKPNQTFVPNGTSADGADSKKSGQPQKPAAEKKEKSSAQKRKKAPEDSTPHWQAMVAAWFAFHDAQKLERPSFTDADPADLQHIARRLEKRARDKGFINWTEEMATERLNAFLKHAWAKEWLRSEFLLHNLRRKFDAIINGNAQQSNSNQRGRAAGGGPQGTVAGAFAAIDRLSD